MKKKEKNPPTCSGRCMIMMAIN